MTFLFFQIRFVAFRFMIEHLPFTLNSQLLLFISFGIFLLPGSALANQVPTSQAGDGAKHVGFVHAPLWAVVLAIVATTSAAVLWLCVLPKRLEIHFPQEQMVMEPGDNEGLSFSSEYGLADAVLIADENDVALDMPWIHSDEFEQEAIDDLGDEEQELGSEPGYGRI
jgi:hypothetical protein